MLLLALLLQASAPGAWGQCVLATADKWAAQRDAADVIADGALSACPAEEARMAAEIRNSGSIVRSNIETARMVARVKSTIRGAVVARVLKARQR